MNGLLKKRFIFPCCVVSMCAPSVLLASPDDLDEITIRVIEGDDLIIDVHNMELPVFGNDDKHDRDDDKDDDKFSINDYSLLNAINQTSNSIYVDICD